MVFDADTIMIVDEERSFIEMSQFVYSNLIVVFVYIPSMWSLFTLQVHSCNEPNSLALAPFWPGQECVVID